MTELGLETSIGTASGPTRGRRTGQHALGHVHTRPERPTHWASTAAACPQSKSAPRSNPHSARCTSVPHVPRLRALALLRRRPSARVETTAMPASEKPAHKPTSTLSRSAADQPPPITSEFGGIASRLQISNYSVSRVDNYGRNLLLPRAEATTHNDRVFSQLSLERTPTTLTGAGF